MLDNSIRIDWPYHCRQQVNHTGQRRRARSPQFPVPPLSPSLSPCPSPPIIGAHPELGCVSEEDFPVSKGHCPPEWLCSALRALRVGRERAQEEMSPLSEAHWDKEQTPFQRPVLDQYVPDGGRLRAQPGTLSAPGGNGSGKAERWLRWVSSIVFTSDCACSAPPSF